MVIGLNLCSVDQFSREAQPLQPIQCLHSESRSRATAWTAQLDSKPLWAADFIGKHCPNELVRPGEASVALRFHNYIESNHRRSCTFVFRGSVYPTELIIYPGQVARTIGDQQPIYSFMETNPSQ